MNKKTAVVVTQETNKKHKQSDGSTKLPTTVDKSTKSSTHRAKKYVTHKDDSSKTNAHADKTSKTTTHKEKVSKTTTHKDKTSKTTTDLTSKTSTDKASKTSAHKDLSSRTPTDKTSKTSSHRDSSSKTSTSTYKPLRKRHSFAPSVNKKGPRPENTTAKEKAKTWKEKNHYALKLSEKQNEDLKQTFAIFDRDRVGEISLSEMVLVNNSMGLDMSHSELQGIIDSVDRDESKMMNFDEFLEMMAQKVSDGSHRKNIVADFRRYDTTKDGFISNEELRDVMRVRGEELASSEIDAMMANVHIGDDETVNYEEFARVMTA